MGRKIHDAFLALQPTVYLMTLDLLYRPHVAELLRRIVEGGDLRDPTAAEMLGLVAESTLAAPPTSQAAALYFRLFRELFPEKTDLLRDDDLEASCVIRGVYGRYPGDVEELRETLRRRMRREIERSVTGRGRKSIRRRGF